MYRQDVTVTFAVLLLIGSVTAGFSGYNPVQNASASTNPNLFVSAENSQFQNYFAGPQVIQVIVSDPDINRLDQAYGEPTVTINGKKLRMAQATDGNWYAYFADRNQAIAADKTVGLAGKGLDFGQFCSSLSTFSPKAGVDYSETKGFTVAKAGITGAVDKPANAAAITACTTATAPAGAKITHVIREEKTLNTNGAGFAANANYTGIWPVVQLYDFSGFPTDVLVDYHKAGGDQIVLLHFDRIPTNLISTSVDRTAYPVNSQVFVQMNDPQLNIDPTEEDSWTWGTNATNSTLYYQAFNRNGGADADGTAGMQNLIGNLTNFMFNHNGQFTLNPAAQGVNVLDFQKNGKEPLKSADGTGRGQTNAVRTASIGFSSAPVTFIESGGVNTGTFADWDGGKIANLITSNTQAIRDVSATIRYNDVSTSIVGGFGFASLTVTATNNTWAGGQKIPVTLTDTDANRNSKITEHLDLFNPAIYNGGTKGVPTMRIGTPFSLSNAGIIDGAITTAITATGFTAVNGIRTVSALGAITPSFVSQADGINVEHIDLVTPAAPAVLAATGGLFIDPGKKMSDLLRTIHDTESNATGLRFKGFNFINYDLRSLDTGATGTFGTVNVYLVFNPAGAGGIIAAGAPVAGLQVVSLANSTSLQDLINLNQTSNKVANGNQVTVNLFHNVPKTASIGFLFTFTGTPTLDTSVKPIVADFFSVGLIGDGTTNDQRINNAIYRWELEETGDNTSTFTGTFAFPDQVCQNGQVVSTVGQNIKVNYVDFRNNTGNQNEVSDNAGFRGITGSIKLDKDVYSVPFGTIGTAPNGDFNAPAKTSTTSLAGVFPMNKDTIVNVGLTAQNTLSNGDVVIHIRVSDKDFDLSPVSTDRIAEVVYGPDNGPVAVQISRQGQSLFLATAGGPSVKTGTIVNLNGTQLPAADITGGSPAVKAVRDLGPMTEIAPDAGIFQADLPIRFTDGPQGSDCPAPDRWTPIDGSSLTTTENHRFHTVHTTDTLSLSGENYCIRQGDVLKVTYLDLTNASGHSQLATYSSTFDLRNGVLQSDQSVYAIGSDMILTLVEPDLNLDSQVAETLPLDLVEWSSQGFKGTIGPLGGEQDVFDARSSTFVETGKDTGIFMSVIKIPKQLGSTLLKPGEEIHLEYSDWGPAGAKVVGSENKKIELTPHIKLILTK